MPHGYAFRYTQELVDDLAARGWDYSDLARHAGISVAAASRVVNGKRVRPETITAVCKALEDHPATGPVARFMENTA